MSRDQREGLKESMGVLPLPHAEILRKRYPGSNGEVSGGCHRSNPMNPEQPMVLPP